MEQITDINAYLDEAKKAIAENEDLVLKCRQLKDERDKADNALIKEKKAQADNITKTIASRRGEIVSTYDTELDAGRKKLSATKAKREKAKAQGVKARISQETEPINTEIKNLNQSIKDICKQNKIPVWTSGNAFLTLFFPKGLIDVLTLILVFVVVFCLLPLGINHVLGDGSTLFLVGCFIADIVIFGGLYILLSRTFAFNHHSEYLQIRAIKKKIRNCGSKIDTMKMSIKADTNEESYNLASFDDDISHMEQELADVTMQRNNALATFDSVTRNIITDELTAAGQPTLDELSAKAEEAGKVYTEAEKQRQSKALEINEKYEVYLGKAFMSVEKIQVLKDVANHSTATTIPELLKEYEKAMDN